ncbi:hypothetical protein [Treponema putidum]|uniref:hypothetical protein n=1 Tax=Treponema putidum TaxID=221027 RepID=UPI003D942C4A
MEYNVGRRLKEYTATAMNTEGENYKKIIANESSVKEEQAAFEEQLNELFSFLENYRESDIFAQEGKHQLKSLNFFSGLKKAPQESLIEFVTKYKGMMIRSEKELDVVWGNKWNIEHALRYFFGHNNCFVMEFTNEQKENVLSEEFTKDKWILNGLELEESTVNLTEDAALVNIKAIKLDDNMQLQTKKSVYIKKGVYSLHFFIRGQTQRPDGSRYGEISVKIGNIFEKKYCCDGAWINIQEFINIEKDEGDYDFVFSGIHSLDIDFICLYPVVSYPSMSILIGNGGLLGRNSMFFGPGTQDVLLDGQGNITEYFEPPYRGTYQKYKFWYPCTDDTEEEAKEERKKNKLKFDDRRWGYWSDEMRWLDVAYINILLDALIPVGVKIFGIIMSKRGS